MVIGVLIIMEVFIELYNLGRKGGGVGWGGGGNFMVHTLKNFTLKNFTLKNFHYCNICMYACSNIINYAMEI